MLKMNKNISLKIDIAGTMQSGRLIFKIDLPNTKFQEWLDPSWEVKSNLKNEVQS
jgi:hypothetical protein